MDVKYEGAAASAFNEVMARSSQIGANNISEKLFLEVSTTNAFQAETRKTIVLIWRAEDVLYARERLAPLLAHLPTVPLLTVRKVWNSCFAHIVD